MIAIANCALTTLSQVDWFGTHSQLIIGTAPFFTLSICSVYHKRLPDLGESGQVTKVSEYVSQTCFPINEPRRESFGKTSGAGVIKEQLSFEYEWSGLEDFEMVDAKVVTEERFDVYLIRRDGAVCVTVDRKSVV